jgi:succinate dehydrogenase / fumarate reductase cytochrome b subunit
VTVVAAPLISQTGLVENTRAARTTIALKFLMAGSGVLFIAFVLVHMYGNLKAFSGHDAYDEYAAHLRVLGTPMLPREGFLWITRIVLILAVVVHFGAGMALWRRAAKARPIKYVVKKHTGAIPAARIMRIAGVWILGFLIWHLINFTIVKVNFSGGATNDPYNLLIADFDPKYWWNGLIYLVSMAFLGAHIHHGTWSAMQTLGWTGSAQSRARARTFALSVAIVIAGGFSLVPIFVLVGVIN